MTCVDPYCPICNDPGPKWCLDCDRELLSPISRDVGVCKDCRDKTEQFVSSSTVAFVQQAPHVSSTAAHYETGGVQAIDVIEAYNLNFNRGSAVKYLCRAGRKDDELQDLKKALDFVQREIARVSK